MKVNGCEMLVKILKFYDNFFFVLAVKSALRNDIVEMKNDDNKNDPRFKEAVSSDVAEEFTLLRLVIKQKELNEKLFGKQPLIPVEGKLLD